MPLSRGWKKAQARRAVLGRTGRPTISGPHSEDHGESSTFLQQTKQSPVICQAQSPVICQAQSPVICQAQSPVICQAQSPVICQAQSPVICQAQSPVICQAQSPVICQAQSPVIGQAQSPVICQAQSHAINSESNNDIIFSSNLPSNKSSADVIEKNLHSYETFSGLKIQSKPEIFLSSRSPDENKVHLNTPPPFVSRDMVFGSFYQGDRRFSVFSRGSQCVMNSLVALLNTNTLKNSTAIDQVLIEGDALYKTVIQNLKTNRTYKSRLLCLEDVPQEITYRGRKHYILKSDIISGVAIEQFGETFLPSLHQSLYTALQNSDRILVMIGAICSSVFFHDAKYYFFDSHSHDENGLATSEGKSVLFSFSNYDDLVTYMYAMYESMCIDLNSQVELLPLHFTENEQQVQSNCYPKHDASWTTVTHKKNKNLHMQESTHIKTKQINEEMKHEDQTVVLIGKYFNDQTKKRASKDQCFKNQRKSDYQKLYKRQQRESMEFRRKEIQAKKNARSNNDQKMKDRLSTLQSMRTIRKSQDYKKNELERKQTLRQSVEQKEKERQRNVAYMKKARTSEVYKEKETEAKRAIRKCNDKKEKERQHTSSSMKKARTSEVYKEKETEAKRAKRKCNDQKEIERLRTSSSMKKARTYEVFKRKEAETKKAKREFAEQNQKEKASTALSMKSARASEEYRKKECNQKRQARQSFEMKNKEQVYQKESKRRARLIREFKEWEAQQKKEKRYSEPLHYGSIDKKSKQKSREMPFNLEKERISKQQYRQNENNKQKEKIIDSSRKSLKRQIPECHDLEHTKAKQRKYGTDIERCIDIFHKNISIGPLYICSCCHQTWFKQSVSKADTLSKEQQAKYLTQYVSVDDKEWVCLTCKNSILLNKIPKLSALNGMNWPMKPKELELFPLEERLISLRIPFMQIRELPRGRQYSIKGNVVNVPTELQPVVDALPRPVDENVVVAVKLKKKLSYSSCAFTENIRPLHVLVALHWLMKHSELYKNSDVEVDEEWCQNVTKQSEDILKEFMNPQGEMDKSNGADSNADLQECHNNSENLDENLCDSDSEETDDLNVGNIDTLVDYSDLENRADTFTFAPGEGQRPLSIYQDVDSEYLCFPTIFCGERRKDNEERSVSINYSDIAKWELRSVDRRAANSVPNIFFKLKKIQMKQLNDRVNVAVRQCQLKGKKLTASQARDENQTEEFVRKDQGYFIFKQLRNSPAYLETRKKDVFAMIRQLGLPTWFMSLSSADTRWSDLLKMLGNLNHGVTYSDDQIENMTWEEKTKLVQKDPVTCSRYFDHRVQEFIKTVLKSDHHPIGKVTDYFYRVEFQQRGSPHIHMIVWVDDAPKFTSNSHEEIVDFVDQYLNCSSSDNDLIQLQIHKHSRTCRKKEDAICRFGYPLPPLATTMVLEPLDSDIDKYRKMYSSLQKRMNSEKEGFCMSYEEFLLNVAKMSEQDYIKCIRSSLKAPKVFLKRSPRDIRVNYYNEIVLNAWKANMDIQFVLDPYACAMYIVSYISKSQRGMSNLMHAAVKEAKAGNMDIKRQVRHVGNVFSNSVEVSAQEAVYLVLQMPLTRSTRDVVFINTSLAGQRVAMLKNKTALEELPADSTDVIADNMINRYSKRPKCIEHYCLADYVSELEIVYPKSSGVFDEEVNDDDTVESDKEIFDDKTIVHLKSGVTIRKRKSKKVIRYVRFNKKNDKENYYREKLLLFYPWRNELQDLLGCHDSFEAHYLQRKNFIDVKVQQYEHHIEELEQARELAENDFNVYDEIAPGTQQQESEDAQDKPSESEEFVFFNPDKVGGPTQYDIGIELESGCGSSARVDQTENILADDDYLSLLRSLNLKQRQFYNHVIHWMKTKDEPVYAFLTGGAGVGKSVVIRCLYQTLYRMLNLKVGENQDDKRVLLCAFTGKAAYNINGSTISSAFMEKFKQSNQTLGCDQLNTFRSKYKSLSVVIIDEISMVSNNKLSFIDQRLQQLTGRKIPFGGISIIAVGDLYQLKPVADTWIFQDLARNASALSPNLWKEHFKMFELTEIMRQKDDFEFTQILNRLRINELTEMDSKVIGNCSLDSDSEFYPKTAPHIFAENSFMHTFNDKMIMSFDSPKVSIDCHDSVVGDNISASKKEQILNRVRSLDTSNTMGLHLSLTIVLGMIYDVTINLDTEDGLNNGSPCVAKYIEYKQAETSRPSIIWVKFEDDKCGKNRRNKYLKKGFYHDAIDKMWTPIFDVERTFCSYRNTIKRIQFPLQPSAGKTVYRAQGTTVDKLVIDLSQKKTRKIPHLHYVALSRVRSMRNLHILNFNEKALMVDEQVVQEMKRLSESKLQLCYVPLISFEISNRLNIVFNNCRSLHKHFGDISADPDINFADVAAFAESRLQATDSSAQYFIEGFQLIRNDQKQNKPGVRPSHGIAVYIKDDIIVNKQFSYCTTEIEFTFLDVSKHSESKQIVFVYKSPSCSFGLLKRTMKRQLSDYIDLSKEIIFIGDFNIDISKPDNSLCQLMEKEYKCTQLIHNMTTDYGSILDLVFANCSGCSGTIEAYWSDHKIVYFSLALRKAKQYDWKDSNLALFGSDTERKVKKESAECEPAWQKAGHKVGVQIWRIVKFKVTEWPKDDYGKFFDGDSYIVLNTFKYDDTEELNYDVHFWIGKYSTQDEYGTAAYKTVELDTFLDDKPIQHREVQGHESDLFRSYFKSITILKGGADSGFRNVKPTEYTPRLLHFHGDRSGVRVSEIPRNKKLLDNTDVYILDLGLKLYQWNGSGSNKEEKMKALHYLKDLQGERGGKCQTETLDEDPRDLDNEFYDALTEDSQDDMVDFEKPVEDKFKELFRLSDASGKMKMTKEKQGDIVLKDFDSKDVFIFDTKDAVFVWIGKQTTTTEKQNAMTYAHNYLMETSHPLIPITCLAEGKKNKSFAQALAA